MQDKGRIVTIIQARMQSSRLPGKVLMDIAGKPMLGHLITRIRNSELVELVLVATTNDSSDDAIQDYCESIQTPCYRGNSFDVLDRYYQAAKAKRAEIIVRLTADCPLVDGKLIDGVITPFIDLDVDFAANRLPPPWKRSFPIGLDIEVVKFSALERAWHESDLQFEREHVLPYLYDKPGRFKTLLIHHDPDFGEKRWTVDTPEDMKLVRSIFEHFYPRIDFSWLEVLDWLSDNPEIELLNKNILHKTVKDIDHRFQPGQK